MPSTTSFYIRVQQVDPPGLRLRAQPSTESETVGFETSGAILTVIESQQSAALKIGVNNQWIHVRDEKMLEGYVAAWYVEAAGDVKPAAVQTQSASAPLPDPLELIKAVNAEREKGKLQTLKVYPILMANAQKHAEYMAASGTIAHESADGSRPFQRHLAAGFPLAGDLSRGGFASENIVANPNMTIAEAIQWWYGDDPHTHTMLGDMYTDCGAGIAANGEMIYFCFDAARADAESATKTVEVVPPPTQGYMVYVPGSLTTGLKIRKIDSMSGALVRVAAAGEWLQVMEPEEGAQAKLGVEGKWLKVKDHLGNTGFVAAWLVSKTK